jgi:hypothetical protein
MMAHPKRKSLLSNPLKSPDSFSLDPNPFKGQTNYSTPRDEAFPCIARSLTQVHDLGSALCRFRFDDCAGIWITS